jgi:nucleoside 2-deoxyribosyltransferase
VSRAGVIDNILRAQICDAAFVLVDLTHDNTGAYWEAGYAEGLNTPVIYLCEQAKFDMAKTHFDTRTRSDAARRSLNLFASSAGSLD